MSPVQHLREFIRERLTAAAEAIFTEVEKTLELYEEELDAQHRRLLEVCWKEQSGDLPEQHVFKDEQCLYNQGGGSRGDQEEAEAPRTEADQEDPFLAQQREQLEAELFKTASVHHEEEHDRLLRLLATSVTPGPKPGAAEQSISEEEESVANHSLGNTEWNLGAEEPPHIKEEEEEPPCSRSGRTPEPDSFKVTPGDDYDGGKTNSLLFATRDQSADGSLLLGSTHETALQQTRRSYDSSNFDALRGHSSSDLVERTVESDVGGDDFEETSDRADKDTFCCQCCGKVFKYASHLNLHMRNHTGERPFSCKICGKSFRLNNYLAVHVRTHTGEKPYSCQLCGKSFNSSGHLHHHLRVHAGEKPFSCDRCWKTFSRSSLLTLHMRTHTGEKPFSCKLCGKPFSDSGNLKRHIRTHTGEKPYSCKTCGKRFSRNSNLVCHMKSHHG